MASTLRTGSAAALMAMLVILLSGPDAGGSAVEIEMPSVSLEPHVNVIHGSWEQQNRLQEAVDRFVAAGLALPDLVVEFSSDDSECDGHMGLFQPAHTPWRIAICSTLSFVYEHELAHAWERANLDDAVREQFMAFGGYHTWNSPTVPWDERGIEGGAFVIQQGLAGLPLPTRLSPEHVRRVQSFVVLTGRPAPVLLDWYRGHNASRNRSGTRARSARIKWQRLGVGAPSLETLSSRQKNVCRHCGQRHAYVE